MSPGRMASPSGMFSTRPMTPTTCDLGFSRRQRMHEADDAGRAAHVALHVLHAGGGLDRDAARIEADALADDRRSASSASSGRRSSAWSRGGFRARNPGPTPSSAFMPSFPIAFSSSTFTSTPSFSSALARSANSAGKSTFGGSLTRLRAISTPSATANRSCEAARAAAAWLEPIDELRRAWRCPPPAPSCGSCTCQTDSRADARPSAKSAAAAPSQFAVGASNATSTFCAPVTLPNTNPPSIDEVDRGVVLAGRDADDDQPRGVEARRREDVERGSLGALEIGRFGCGSDQRFEIAELRGHGRRRLHVRSNENDERATLSARTGNQRRS